MNLAQAEAWLRAAAGQKSVEGSIPALPGHTDDIVTAVTAKHDQKGDTSSPVSSFPSSPALSMKKGSHDTTMASPEEELKHKSTREYCPLPKQPEVDLPLNANITSPLPRS
ncbi:uncharacterized protein LACBIDRAFT_336267 [Laccaria bicolor S238N-H82]|uniref:Predicted protein n=1 Tax=Laccaria bicolor (strain S238N-H82 / ATCC MYA-4686) TaxID=486041 RepID=B0E4Y0_LACBS|nr:uncharacterized protein LACBIDRAFT_336267 [Laccaria bicolor S238N-H82]EDQ98101.1 predicted protein [Laccaria bicolor S238N-H82]|eukprot:XP_001891248.1 predicted protein [Laccaria bicolor S238N-H82]